MTVKKLLSNVLSMSLPKSQSLAPLLQAQNTSFGLIHTSGFVTTHVGVSVRHPITF